MTPTKQTVYLHVKVEDELPEKEVICVNISNDLLVGHVYKIDDDDEFQCEDNHQILAQVTYWLKPQKVFVFTPEQLNEYTANVVKQALETAAEKANSFIDGDESVYIQGNVWSEVDKQSITNTFEEIFQKYKV